RRILDAAGPEGTAEALGGAPPLETHVGYWLVGEGLQALEREVGYRPPLRARLVRAARRRPGLTYVGAIAAAAAALMAGAWGVAVSAGAAGPLLLLALLASVLPALDLAVALTNWLVTRLFPPARLPKLAFEGGVPPEHRAFVVVPTLLTSPENARRQVEHLEVQALANPDPS